MRLRLMICAAVASGLACRGGDRAPGASGPPDVATPSAAAPAASSAPVPSAIASAPSPAPSSTARTWSFDGDTAGAPPGGFSFGRTGGGAEGKWIVKAENGAPSGAQVLAQIDADTTDDRFPVAWANEPVLKDVDVRVRCKPISGKVDQACGLVFRLRDTNNYYLTRANALEDNVRLYFVKNGHRQQIASHSGKVAPGQWHELRATARGDHFEVFFDGAKIIDQRDATFADAGRVGVWTKADSVTYFDDLSVGP